VPGALATPACGTRCAPTLRPTAARLPSPPPPGGPPRAQVWVKPELREDGRVYWAADSDSQLTKGLAALLVLGLSGCTPAEILQTQPEFIEMLGLKQSLTPSRNNGFLNMFLKMQKLTLGMVVAGASAAPVAAGTEQAP